MKWRRSGDFLIVIELFDIKTAPIDIFPLPPRLVVSQAVNNFY
jgi:hypothetical protein